MKVKEVEVECSLAALVVQVTCAPALEHVVPGRPALWP